MNRKMPRVKKIEWKNSMEDCFYQYGYVANKHFFDIVQLIDGKIKLKSHIIIVPANQSILKTAPRAKQKAQNLLEEFVGSILEEGK